MSAPQLKRLQRRIDIAALVEEDNFDGIKTALTTAATLVKDQRISRILSGTSVALGVGRYIYKYYKDTRTKNNYLIKIMETDPLYAKIQDWLIAALPAEEQRNIMVLSKQSTGNASIDPVSDSSDTWSKDPKKDVLSLIYDGERKQTISIAGYPVSVHIAGEENVKTTGNRSQITSMRSLYLETSSLEAREAIVNTLRTEAKKFYTRRPRFFTAMKWGSFRNVSDIPVRPLETVILRKGQKESIVQGLKTFLSQEKEYMEMGMPWHTGILLYGPPGSGKTSVATALAHSMGLDVYTVSLSALEDDNTLLDLVGDVTPRSILLLEDVDVAHAATDRDDDRTGVTLSGLLNSLDGIATPHGIIVIMTTNHFGNLDPAIVRPGRVDYLEEIGYVDDLQIQELCQQFIGRVINDLPSVEDADKIVAADIVGIFKKNIETPENIDNDLREVILEKKKAASPQPTVKASNGASHVGTKESVLEVSNIGDITGVRG